MRRKVEHEVVRRHTLQNAHLLTHICGGACSVDDPDELVEQRVAYAVGGFAGRETER